MELGKITTSARAKKKIAKASTSVKRKIAKATKRILKTYKKAAGKAIDAAVKKLNVKARTAKKGASKPHKATRNANGTYRK